MKAIQDPNLLIGTYFADEDEEATGGLLLNRLVLDSDTVVAYTVGPRARPGEETDIIRLEKPLKLLAMSVLHHKLTVAQDLFPDHPLLLAPDARMQNLETEILLRAQDRSLEMRVPFSRALMDLALVMLLSEMQERSDPEDFRPSDLFERRNLTGRIDDHLLERIREVLEEVSEESEIYAGLQRLAKLIPVGIREQQRLGAYFPNCANPLINLMLLFVEDYLSQEELFDICEGTMIGEQVTPFAVDRFISACALIYNHARQIRQRLVPEDDHIDLKTCGTLGEDEVAGLAEPRKPSFK